MKIESHGTLFNNNVNTRENTEAALVAFGIRNVHVLVTFPSTKMSSFSRDMLERNMTSDQYVFFKLGYYMVEYSPIGQSFTSTRPEKKFEFFYHEVNEDGVYHRLSDLSSVLENLGGITITELELCYPSMVKTYINKKDIQTLLTEGKSVEEIRNFITKIFHHRHIITGLLRHVRVNFEVVIGNKVVTKSFPHAIDAFLLGGRDIKISLEESLLRNREVLNETT